MAFSGNIYHTFSIDDHYLIVFSGKGTDLPASMKKDFCLGKVPFIQAEQVHGTDVQVVRTPEEQTVPAVDALVTAQPECGLLIRTADCVPIIIADTVTGAIAAVHSGLRGTVGSIITRTVETMHSEFSSSPADMKAFIGPSIKQCCYEIDQPVISRLTHLPFIDDIVLPQSNGKYMLNLQKYNMLLLIQSGVREDNITVVDICTGCNPELFYSYRKRKDTDRMYSLVVRR